MDAKTAHGIIKETNYLDEKTYPGECYAEKELRRRSLIYLEALSGPEVKVLIEALEFFKNVNTVMGPSAINLTAIKAIAKFKQLTEGK